MYDMDDNFIPCDDDGNHLARAQARSDTSSHDSTDPFADDNSKDVYVTVKGSDIIGDSSEAAPFYWNILFS
jgi:hypothetical protein